MPLFSNKFSPKKTPIRKASVSLANKDLSPQRLERELGPEIGPIRICLGEQQAVFENGIWIPESGQIGGTYKENEMLKKEITKLEEENNLLKIKFEVLFDMEVSITAILCECKMRKISCNFTRKFEVPFSVILPLHKWDSLRPKLIETTAESNLYKEELEILRSRSPSNDRPSEHGDF